MKKIAVFCGSSMGASEAYASGAQELGKELARRGLSLVYGGANVGLMGAVANSVLSEGGEAIGILPGFLKNREIAHPLLSELVIVDSMHERKAKMAELADGFIVLPGGAGTMDEFFEIFTWLQLGLHAKPCGLLNVNRYFDPLIALIAHMADENFLQEKYRTAVLVDEDPGELLNRFATYGAPDVKTYDLARRA
ncbi:TIGR00730 family Rossman fold protein [Cohnella algarum]|uniref:LOG family protein n=1 Tax=Cohnella algarum TaxID=2044859 RepID=UPI001968726A|nr:TIGR00730 family Rossman fold protein [Cohnella algarum]MBN2984196.1 TIGR00730 family Rossman fold protein [Cohnella algarum]